MKVSIVIPAHNEEKYIGKTLEAVLGLNHPDFEVIVVDNASTDKTAEVVRNFKSVKLCIEPNKGTQSARERGRKEATGEIIACLDADCIPDKNWLNQGLRYFTNSRVVAVTGPNDYYDMNPLFRYVAQYIQKIIYKAIHVTFHSLHIGSILIAGNCFIRASALEHVGGYDTSITFYGDDTDTAKKLLPTGTLLFKNNLMVKSSGRRFKTQGILNTFSTYIYVYFKVTFKKKDVPRIVKKI